MGQNSPLVRAMLFPAGGDNEATPLMHGARTGGISGGETDGG
jgi:hypothetical protein